MQQVYGMSILGERYDSKYLLLYLYSLFSLCNRGMMFWSHTAIKVGSTMSKSKIFSLRVVLRRMAHFELQYQQEYWPLLLALCCLLCRHLCQCFVLHSLPWRLPLFLICSTSISFLTWCCQPLLRSLYCHHHFCHRHPPQMPHTQASKADILLMPWLLHWKHPRSLWLLHWWICKARSII